MTSSRPSLNGITRSGEKAPESWPGATAGLPQYGQVVTATVPSEISSAPHDEQI